MDNSILKFQEMKYGFLQASITLVQNKSLKLVIERNILDIGLIDLPPSLQEKILEFNSVHWHNAEIIIKLK